MNEEGMRERKKRKNRRREYKRIIGKDGEKREGKIEEEYNIIV